MIALFVFILVVKLILNFKLMKVGYKSALNEQVNNIELLVFLLLLLFLCFV